MLSPDDVAERRQILKLSRDRVASEMTGAGHDWSEASVMLVEVGELELTEEESADLAAILGIHDGADPGLGRAVTITIGDDGSIVIDQGDLDDDQLIAMLARALNAATTN